MSVIENLKWRYATKKFDDSKKLSKEKIEILKEAFNLTALSYGLQTLKLVMVEDLKKREQLVSVAYGQRQVVDASHLLILCIQKDINENDVEDYYKSVKSIRNTPDTILDPFKNQLKSTVSDMSSSKKKNWATNQAYIALGNLMTVCAIEKIDSCPMEGFQPSKLDDILNLEQEFGLNSVLLLPVGYRATDDMFADFEKVRKPLSESIIEL